MYFARMETITHRAVCLVILVLAVPLPAHASDPTLATMGDSMGFCDYASGAAPNSWPQLIGAECANIPGTTIGQWHVLAPVPSWWFPGSAACVNIGNSDCTVNLWESRVLSLPEPIGDDDVMLVSLGSNDSVIMASAEDDDLILLTLDIAAIVHELHLRGYEHVLWLVQPPRVNFGYALYGFVISRIILGSCEDDFFDADLDCLDVRPFMHQGIEIGPDKVHLSVVGDAVMADLIEDWVDDEINCKRSIKRVFRSRTMCGTLPSFSAPRRRARGWDSDDPMTRPHSLNSQGARRTGSRTTVPAKLPA